MIFIKRISALMLVFSILLASCESQTAPKEIPASSPEDENTVLGGTQSNIDVPDTSTVQNTPAEDSEDKTFGEDLTQSEIYEGYFEGVTSAPTVSFISGTSGINKTDKDTITFGKIKTDTVYAISGNFTGTIIIDVGDNYKFDLELTGASIKATGTSPAIVILSGDKVSITAKKGTKNFIYDEREAQNSELEGIYSGAIHSETDLEICGKGELSLVSTANNGIHSKKDLEIKNLTLSVVCVDNAIKGNDSVTVTNAVTTLIASRGDAIKTSNSNISSKGNQRGTVTIAGGTHNLYAACDGIDAAYDVVIDDAATVLNIYTDKYSNYSDEVTANEESVYYIRFTSNAYSYSVKYYNSDDDFEWVSAEHHSTVSSGRTNYYYFSFPKKTNYSKMQFFIYSEGMKNNQEDEFLVSSELLTPNTAYDTFALMSSNGYLTYSWTNYTTTIQPNGWGSGQGGRPGMGGFGGFGEGNKDKGSYSTKGIKAFNEITIINGTVTVKSYDDAIHANNDSALENNETPLGNVTVLGGTLNLYSNDDGIHADGTLTVKGGNINILSSYEGLEAQYIRLVSGNVTITSKDDGVNATASSGEGVVINGGTLFIHAGGDGIDSNVRSSYRGIVFAGGKVVVVSTSGGNSAIDTENGYRYDGGCVVAIMPRGAMTNEALHCQNFSSIGKSLSFSGTQGDIYTAMIGAIDVTFELPATISGTAVILGSNSATIQKNSSI